MTPQDKYFLLVLTTIIGMMIQWAAHYIKGDGTGLDAIILMILVIITAILISKK